MGNHLFKNSPNSPNTSNPDKESTGSPLTIDDLKREPVTYATYASPEALNAQSALSNSEALNAQSTLNEFERGDMSSWTINAQRAPINAQRAPINAQRAPINAQRAPIRTFVNKPPPLEDAWAYQINNPIKERYKYMSSSVCDMLSSTSEDTVMYDARLYDLRNMTQKNLETGRTRKIIRVFLGDQNTINGWGLQCNTEIILYPQEVQEMLSALSAPESVTVDMNGYSYVIDTQALTQTNLKTGRVRSIMKRCA